MSKLVFSESVSEKVDCIINSPDVLKSKNFKFGLESEKRISQLEPISSEEPSCESEPPEYNYRDKNRRESIKRIQNHLSHTIKDLLTKKKKMNNAKRKFKSFEEIQILPVSVSSRQKSEAEGS